MVILSKIYTKKGDFGITELGDGKKIKKFSSRVETYGTVDELNSVIGIVACLNIDKALKNSLEQIQNDLFDLGADLCLPEENKKNSTSKKLKVVNSLTKRLEMEIDEMNKSIKPIKSFVLPGGNAIASHLHLCRTVCRRAERRVVELMEAEEINLEILKYLNRLSDWFFVAARKSNNNGENDILWKPAMNS